MYGVSCLGLRVSTWGFPKTRGTLRGSTRGSMGLGYIGMYRDIL